MNNTKKGFTLVELLVVIAILAILATVTVVGYSAFIERAEKSNATTEAHQIETTIESFLMTDKEYVLATAEADLSEANKVTYTKIWAELVNGEVVIKANKVTCTSPATTNEDGTVVDAVKTEELGVLYTGTITVAETSDFYGLKGELVADEGTLEYHYDEDTVVDVFAN